MRFLVQTIGGRIVYDFVFALRQAADYYAWRGGEKIVLKTVGCKDAAAHGDGREWFADVRRPDQWTPVGSVEFVSQYLRMFYPGAVKALRPVNVPDGLFRYAGRIVCNVCEPSDVRGLPFREGDVVFRKSLDVIKHPANGAIRFGDALKDGLVGFQVSGFLDLASEWRVLVFHGDVLHAANYAGDPLRFPDAETLLEMVRAYGGKAPAAWTLDVGVTEDGRTVVIECHRFFSCGLYGFNDYVRLPAMLSQTWYQMKTASEETPCLDVQANGPLR